MTVMELQPIANQQTEQIFRGLQMAAEYSEQPFKFSRKCH